MHSAFEKQEASIALWFCRLSMDIATAPKELCISVCPRSMSLYVPMQRYLLSASGAPVT